MCAATRARTGLPTALSFDAITASGLSGIPSLTSSVMDSCRMVDSLCFARYASTSSLLGIVREGHSIEALGSGSSARALIGIMYVW